MREKLSSSTETIKQLHGILGEIKQARIEKEKESTKDAENAELKKEVEMLRNTELTYTNQLLLMESTFEESQNEIEMMLSEEELKKLHEEKSEMQQFRSEYEEKLAKLENNTDQLANSMMTMVNHKSNLRRLRNDQLKQI